MYSWTVIAIDVDGARYCLDGTPLSADEAESEGIGGPVFADQLEETEHCDKCNEEL